MHGKMARFILVLVLGAGVGCASRPSEEGDGGSRPVEEDGYGSHRVEESRRFDVTGKVTYNGAAFNKPDGRIVFIGAAGEQVAAEIRPDGTYQANGVSAGLNRVAVYYPNPKATSRPPTKLKPGEEPPPAAPLFLTPPKYASPETSELSVTVDRETVFNVDLVDPERRWFLRNTHINSPTRPGTGHSTGGR
jgi:hypothetical protein